MAVLTNLLFVLTFGLTVTTEVDLQKKIIGGENCAVHERLYHVKFEYPCGYLLCGGSLIGDRWILTAAHCWKGGMIARLSPHPGPGQEVLFGQHYTLENVDIMLVELQKPTTNIPHIRLPDCANRPLQIDDVVRIAGYGSNQVGADNRIDDDVEAAVLQCADFRVVNHNNITDDDDEFTSVCFEVDTTHVDISPGDSGGGVVFNNAIYGVVQGGNGTYAHAGPASFVDVCYYMNWITATTGLGPQYAQC